MSCLWSGKQASVDLSWLRILQCAHKRLGQTDRYKPPAQLPQRVRRTCLARYRGEAPPPGFLAAFSASNITLPKMLRDYYTVNAPDVDEGYLTCLLSASHDAVHSLPPHLGHGLAPGSRVTHTEPIGSSITAVIIEPRMSKDADEVGEYIVRFGDGTQRTVLAASVEWEMDDLVDHHTTFSCCAECWRLITKKVHKPHDLQSRGACSWATLRPSLPRFLS